MLNIKEKIDINKFLEVLCFFKQKSRGYNTNKANVFSADEIQNFLNNSPDELDLDKKVIILFGIFGTLRGGELALVTIQDVKRQGDLYHIKIPKTKTMKPRSFIIPEEYTTIVEKYVKLSPIPLKTDRFFLNYQKGKCTVQPIGKNKIAGVPQKIAEFLNLSNPQSYRGHSFRRTSATMIVNAGGDLTMLKRAGGWKSSAVAESYIDESMANKQKVGNLLSKMIGLPSTTVQTPGETSDKKDQDKKGHMSEVLSSDVLTDKRFNFTNCNITFNFK